MHVTPPLHAYMTVTLMLHAYNMSVYMTCMLLTLMVLCMVYACNMNVDTCYSNVDMHVP